MFLIIAGVLVVLSILYFRRNYGTLEKTGAPVVKPYFIFGSGPILVNKYMMREVDIERSREYGKVWGSYIMGTPWVNVADADVIRQITVKDFDHFTDHDYTMVTEQKYRHIEIAKYPEWRELRKSLTPVLTTSKIKGMLAPMKDTISNLVSFLDAKIDGTGDGQSAVVDMKDAFQYTSLDVIAKVALATDSNSFKNPNNRLLQMTRAFFEEFTIKDTFTSIFLAIILEFPFLNKPLGLTTPASMIEVWKITKMALDVRRRSNQGGKVGDLIDRIIDIQEMRRKGQLTAVTDEQIISLGNSFLVNGFDTVASGLSTLVYLLSKHPEIQDQVIVEVDDNLAENDGLVNNETVAELPLLEACIYECLRIIPLVYRFDRKCTKNWSYKNLKIPKGMSVGLAYNAIHMDPDYWPEPELFKPERFFKENRENIVPGSYQAFGNGPRACIGERFALIQMKITMVRLFQKYRFEMSEKTKLELQKGELFMNTFPNMFVRIKRRT